MPTIPTANPRIKCRIANDCMNAISGSAERRPTTITARQISRARLCRTKDRLIRGRPARAQLFLLVLAVFLEPPHISRQLFLQRFYFIEFSGSSSLFDLVGQEDFPLGDFGVERRIDLCQLGLLLRCEHHTGRAFLQPLHREFVGRFHRENRCSLRWRNQFLSYNYGSRYSSHQYRLRWHSRCA